MKTRKFLHIAAILFSSVASLLSHGSANAETTAKKVKKSGSDITKAHRKHGDSGEAGDAADPSAAVKTTKTGKTVVVNNLILHNAKGESAAATAKTPVSTDKDKDISAPPKKLDPALMASAERSTPADSPTARIASASKLETAPPPLPGDEASRYPWKRQIVTTTFWIGENSSKNNPVPNRASSWDPKWAQNFGGSDEPDATKRTSDYRPAAFTPGQNPFYVALPYNDMEHGAHKIEAAKVIPWFYKEYKGPNKSVCHGRWIAIRSGNKVCYAQWEDAGPFRTDHWEYVFGSARPKPNLNRGAGLDVSPAVRDFLGINSSDVTDWKFVDFDEVPQGPWAKFGDNNTFVQNARKSGTAVAQVQESKAKKPVTLRDLTAGEIAETEIR